MARILRETSSHHPAVRIDRLRQELSSLESNAGLAGRGLAPLGIEVIDAALGGGLACGALHEIAAASATQIAAATGFALALAARERKKPHQASTQISSRVIVWITEEHSLAEHGSLYGPGLDEAGIGPERLITVTVPRTRDALWAMEEALRSPAVGVVIGETGSRAIDAVATRRLSLAAAAGGTRGFLLRASPDDAPCAFATRWIIGAAPSSTPEGHHGIGPPRFTARLVRNRRGHPGAWIVEWSSAEQRFELATDSQPMAGAAFNRPHRAAAA
jgi:protein ImuA